MREMMVVDRRFVNYIREGIGTPVILIHGLAASLHDWDFIIPGLATSGYDACALDLLGHGDSLKPGQMDHYNIENVFEHLSTWMDLLEFSEPFTIIGHSLGAYLALLYAIRFPQKARSLILVNPFFNLRQLPYTFQLVFRYPLINTTMIERTPYWMFRLMIDLTSLHIKPWIRASHTLPEIVREQTALDYKRAAPEIFNIPRTMCDLTPELSQILKPTQVIWGVNDQTLDPASFHQLVQRLPNASWSVMPSCGHVPHQCHPSDFNKLVMDFLQ